MNENLKKVLEVLGVDTSNGIAQQNSPDAKAIKKKVLEELIVALSDIRKGSIFKVDDVMEIINAELNK